MELMQSQADTPPPPKSAEALRLPFPVASDHGKPVTGRISTETIFDDSTSSRITLPYAAAALDQSGVKVTVRPLADSPQQALAASDWHFDDNRHITLTRPSGMDAGAIYRVEYVAKDPWVMGLGFAATRDFISWLRHAPAGQGNPLADIGSAPCERDGKGACANPQGGTFSSAVAFGGSQSGRYLRDFLWQGFNRDLAGSRVFDGVIPFIPGAIQGMIWFFLKLFVFLFISSMNTPRDLIAVRWFRIAASINPVSYLIECVRSLIITGWDTRALALGFGFATLLAIASLTAASWALRQRMERT